MASEWFSTDGAERSLVPSGRRRLTAWMIGAAMFGCGDGERADSPIATPAEVRPVLRSTSLLPASDDGAGTEAANAERLGQGLDGEAIGRFAALVLSGIDREYPNKPSNVLAGPQDVLSPKQLYPAFYGNFDWHSSVHGHWVLVRLLVEQPDHPDAPAMRQALDRHLTLENLQRERAFFETPENRSFERMYGWAWFLRLVAELHAWDDPDAKRWRQACEPLEELLVARTLEYLPKLQFPIRTGVHPNTAFALGEILDYARIVGRDELERAIVARARDYFGTDRDYPDRYEPSGEDFLSPGLCEADLMRRVLEPQEFAAWLDRFLPIAWESDPGPMLTPVDVSDVTDGKIVHLAGLDLSRAWCLDGIASRLPEGDSRRAVARRLGEAHLSKGLDYVFSGHYEGDHWLGTFAVYALTGTGRAASR